MNTKSKLIALTTASLIALAPVSANAATFSDSVFSWPTNYETETVSEGISTFDGNTKTLSVEQSKGEKKDTPAPKRK